MDDREYLHALLQRSDHRFDAFLAELRLQREADQQFMRELTLRSERLHRDTSRRTDEMARKTDEIVRRTDEIIGEQRARRGALLAILDRLGAGPAPPAPPL